MDNVQVILINQAIWIFFKAHKKPKDPQKIIIPSLWHTIPRKLFVIRLRVHVGVSLSLF